MSQELQLRWKGARYGTGKGEKMGSIFISEAACRPLREALEQTGHSVYTVKSSDAVYDAISAHPDIYMCRIKNVLVIDEMTVTEPDLKEIYMAEMEEKAEDFSETPLIPALRPEGHGGYIVFEMGGIGYEYPFDIAYNAVATDRFFIHNTEWTSPSLLDRARDAGLEIISVKQGYTKCSCVVAGDNALITADEGILRAVEAYNEMIREEMEENGGSLSESGGFSSDGAFMTIDELLQRDRRENCLIDILPVQKGHVALEGFEYGFLGGASGCIDGRVYFNGDLSAHPDFEKIREFLAERGYETVYFEGEPLTDIGSIVYLP